MLVLCQKLYLYIQPTTFSGIAGPFGDPCPPSRLLIVEVLESITPSCRLRYVRAANYTQELKTGSCTVGYTCAVSYVSDVTLISQSYV